MSKKVKGQKLDLASFVGPSNPQMSLPTAPDPSRVKNNGGRGGGFDGARDRFGDKERFDSNRPDRGDRGDNRGERSERPESRADSAASWGRGDRNGPQDSRDNSSFGGPRRGPSSNTRFNQKEEIDDPRFAGKFGSGGGDAYRPVFGRQQQKSEDVTSFALPSGPRSTQTTGAPQTIPVPVAVPTVSAEVKAMEELKIAKVAEKKEIQNKAKAAKEQAAEAAAAKLAQQKADALVAAAAAKEILATGLKGAELLAAAKASTLKTSGSQLLKEIFAISTDVATSTWFTKAEYGTVLHAFLSVSVKDQTAALFVVQEYVFGLKFPKVEVKGVSRRLIEVLFGILLNNDLVDLDGFLAWADDDTEVTLDSNGRGEAIVQTTNFIAQVRQATLNGHDDNEEEDDEIDAVMQFVK